MPHSTYKRDSMGTAVITPNTPITAGSIQPVTLTYTAGPFGIDDTGGIRVCWRFATDTGKPQLVDPTGMNYVSVEASNGARLQCVYETKGNRRPWYGTLFIRVVRGFFREGDQIIIRYGDPRQGSPGMRWQTFCEETFEFQVLVDAFATYDFVEIRENPTLQVVPGEAVRWRCVLPSSRRPGETFRAVLIAEDRCGNPTNLAHARLDLQPSQAIEGLPKSVQVTPGSFATLLDGLSAPETSDPVEITVLDEHGRPLTVSNPLRVVANTPWQTYWADLHGQSEETIGTGSAREYFQFARDRAFVDACCHQGNDFQITKQFWDTLQALTREFDEPGRFVAFPGYEWSGNTGKGGDHNVIYLNEGEPIFRSSHAMLEDLSDEDTDCHTSQDLVKRLKGRDVFLFAHVGGRYADISLADYHPFQPAVEIHSAWGTFEWLLHDAFDLGMKPGIVGNSDGHNGRPGAYYPSATNFGSVGGLTGYLARELSRAAIFEALHARRHFATTGSRTLLEVQARANAAMAIMGEDMTVSGRALTLEAAVWGSAPIERVDIFNGKNCVATHRPYGEKDLGNVLAVIWQGAEYRGRGRETRWDGRAELRGNTFGPATALNFWHPDRPLVRESEAALSWNSITTGGFSGFRAPLSQGAKGTLHIETPLVTCDLPVESIGLEDTCFDADGLGRKLRVFRLPDALPPKQFRFTQEVTLQAGQVNPIYARVTQYDGHQAWSSPIYVSCA